MLKEITLPPIDMKNFSDQTIDSNLIIMSHDFNVNELVIPFYETTVFDTYEAFYTFQGNTSIIIQEVYNQHNEIRIPIVNDVRRHKGIFTIELNASSGSNQATLLKLNVMVRRSNIDSNSEFLFNHYYKLFEDYEKELEDLTNGIKSTIGTQVTQSQKRLQEVSKTLILVNDTADGFITDVVTKQADVTSKYNAFDTSVTQTLILVNDTADGFITDVATKQADVTSKYNAFDTSVTQAGQTIDEILALQPQFQSVLDETEENERDLVNHKLDYVQQLAEDLQDTHIFRTLPNGVKDEIVSGVFNKKVKERVLQASDITLFDNSSVGFTLFKILKSLDDSLYGNNTNTLSESMRWYIPNYSPSQSITLNSYTNFEANGFVIGLAKGTTVAQARTLLAGITITYQLATPVIVPLPNPISPNALQIVNLTEQVGKLTNAIISLGGTIV